ncbi:TIGR03084 family metal-binding protein [Actinoplanes sp. NPDC000266]
MPADLNSLRVDLAAESDELFRLLNGADLSLATPAEGWTIHDQVTHLAYYDHATRLAITDPDRFRRDALGEPETVAVRYRALMVPEVVPWLRRERDELLRIYTTLPADRRLPWFGPAMSVASSITARLMETWAHGQDIADALGVPRRPSGRLRHIAHLGVRTFGWSFQVHGRPDPGIPVRVELDAPDGSRWEWGPQEAVDRVTGPAEDFCLVVTQRRHVAATALEATGPAAIEWLSLAQAYAGPPGSGRPRN